MNPQINTSTDYYVGLVANDEKLVTSQDRWQYDPNDKTEELDTNVDQYITSNHDTVHDNVRREQNNENERQPERERTMETDQYPERTCENDNYDEDITSRKLKMISKLASLKKAGVKLSQNYGMHSDLKAMEYEYKIQIDVISNKSKFLKNPRISIFHTDRCY